MQERLALLPGDARKYEPLKLFRVPACFREANKVMYEPLEVSIGPYHHGTESLRSMEEYKWKVLRDFLSRNPDVGLDVYLLEMKNMEADARKWYGESINLGSDEFVMMLVLDGCFIIEYFLKRENSEFDAFFGVAGWSVKSDLLLLENQIPFFVIHKLFSVHASLNVECNENCSLLKLVVRYFPGSATFTHSKPSCKEINHLLHLFYWYLTFNATKIHSIIGTPEEYGTFSGIESRYSWLESTGKNDKQEDITVPCVTELHEAGVKFRLKKNFSHYFDITFENGIIELPLNVLNKPWCRILTNIVTFEQNLPMKFRIGTSYAQLMDLLVNNEKDVVLLEQKGVIENWLGSEEAAAAFFNQLGRCGILDIGDHYFLGFMNDVRAYARLPWPRYRAKLMHDYFNNPWSSISILAGGSLLVLTVVQTYYTISHA
ncbi:hypothetical protein LUZ62_068254 [Rhynchospora pubera]|uniref:Uncharacterized protein n=1 Tax=Rhynchospora pubera TaxID=906938 RepID=A0AAV8CQF3_9POAL|nr:hypothetical protein LUZ62_068254 [Rhynchospora pubera]